MYEERTRQPYELHHRRDEGKGRRINQLYKSCDREVGNIVDALQIESRDQRVHTRSVRLTSPTGRTSPLPKSWEVEDTQTLKGSTENLQYGLAGAQDVIEIPDPLGYPSFSAMRLETSAAPALSDQQKHRCLPSRGDASLGQSLLPQAARSRDV